MRPIKQPAAPFQLPITWVEDLTGGGTLTPGDSTLNFTAANTSRMALVHVPPQVTSGAVPLVIALHGNGDTAGFIKLAEKISGQQLDDLFRTWLYTPGKPTL